MVAPGKSGNRPGELGGVPGEYAALQLGEPVAWHPELQQRALYRAEGGAEVVTDEQGQTPSTLAEPEVGTGGARQRSESFS